MIEYDIKQKRVIVHKLEDFDPVHTFECGQCFRWRKLPNGHWFSVVRQVAGEVEWTGSDLIFYHTSPEIFEKIWRNYFDLDRDYSALKQKLASRDPILKEAVAYGWGLRLLRQDFYETLISFLISQNNGIPRIKKIVDSLSRGFGTPVDHPEVEDYAFPAAGVVAALSKEELDTLRAGYRDVYIKKASEQLLLGEVTEEELVSLETEEARLKLRCLMGVGEKVADCVLLFSGIKQDVFPVDRWVKRVMSELYFGREADSSEILSFSRHHFGQLAGLAQQYLFYYARDKKIGLTKEKAML